MSDAHSHQSRGSKHSRALLPPPSSATSTSGYSSASMWSRGSASSHTTYLLVPLDQTPSTYSSQPPQSLVRSQTASMLRPSGLQAQNGYQASSPVMDQNSLYRMWAEDHLHWREDYAKWRQWFHASTSDSGTNSREYGRPAIRGALPPIPEHYDGQSDDSRTASWVNAVSGTAVSSRSKRSHRSKRDSKDPSVSSKHRSATSVSSGSEASTIRPKSSRHSSHSKHGDTISVSTHHTRKRGSRDGSVSAEELKPSDSVSCTGSRREHRR